MVRFLRVAVGGGVVLTATLVLLAESLGNSPSVTSPAAVPTGQAAPHRWGLVMSNPGGRQLIIDNIVVGADRNTLYYHVFGLKGISASQVGIDPRYQTESPTLIRVVVDGKPLAPLDAWTQGVEGSTTRQGEFIVRWTGGTPHHIHISVERIEGDLQAHWTIDADL